MRLHQAGTIMRVQPLNRQRQEPPPALPLQKWTLISEMVVGVGSEVAHPWFT